jgi:diguanylate cyclase (GGDEF)-like protein
MAGRGATAALRSSTTWVVILAMSLALTAIAVITALQAQAHSSRDAQVTLGHVETEFNALQSVPYDAVGAPGGPAYARVAVHMRASEQRIEAALAQLRESDPTPHLVAAIKPYRANRATLEQIRSLLSRGRRSRADGLGPISGRLQRTVERDLRNASGEYRERAARSETLATFGSAVVILVLLSLFGFFYIRSRQEHATAEMLGQENARLLQASREEALTDPLTGLGNRRALSADLEMSFSSVQSEGAESVLALFDLDGFKAYNDTFGHPAGDALLVRLARRLATTLQGLGTGYRIGGDEFCILAGAGSDAGDAITRLAAAALSEEGNAFSIGCSYGRVLLPSEAVSADQALRLADQQMYGQKALGRASASRQSSDVLLKVVAERGAGLQEQSGEVGRWAELCARSLGLGDLEVDRIRLGAELRNIGKTALPDTILNKPGPLDEEERKFVRRHTLIGERILDAAPSLAHTADLVRSSHERMDGYGYPDGLTGEAIPLGSRVIAVCGAYDAMVSSRPYRERRSPGEALAELRSCSGTQFDPRVVAGFIALVEDYDHLSVT